MKLNIFNEQKSEEKEICLKLQKTGEKVAVVVCNPTTGNTLPSGHLITFQPNGRIYRHFGISSLFNLDLDSSYRIKED